VFRHVVLLQWTPEATAEQTAAVLAALATLPGAIPELVEYRFGPDVGVNEGNFDLAVVADFASVDDYVVYRDHPVHRAVITEQITPILAARAAVQYDVG
jgi:hypothetical protein